MNRRAPATRAELQRAVNMDAIEPNKQAAAARLKVNPKTYSSWLTRCAAEGIVADQVAHTEEWQQEKFSLEDQLREMRSQISAARRQNLTDAIVRKQILGLAEMSPEPPKWLARPSRVTDKIEDVPCLMVSDWHWGEVVDPAQINGVNEYSIAIAQRRFRKLIERTIDLCKRHQKGNSSAEGIVMMLGGDMVSGDIHDELRETNEIPMMPVMLDIFGVLIWAIDTLADHFGRVFIPCVAGNHGRNTVAPRFKDYNYSNFDWLLYNFLEKHFAKDKRVQFFIPAGTDAQFTVAGRRILLTHGNNLGVRGGDGIIGSLGPIVRGDVKIRRMQNAISLPYDTLVMGHWHQYIPLDWIIVNGSGKGYDEFAKNALRAVPEPPRQALFHVHPRWGITSQRAVYVDEPQATGKTDFVTWPKVA